MRLVRGIFNLSLLALLSVIAGGVASATDAAVTVPSIGIDMPGTITAAGLAMGTVVAACVGLYFAYWIVKKGLTWAHKAG